MFIFKYYIDHWNKNAWEPNKAFTTLLREDIQTIFKINTYILDDNIDITLVSNF